MSIARDRWLGLAVLILAVVWVIVLNNGASHDTPDAERFVGFSLVAVPRVARVIEAFVVGAGVILLWPRIRRAGADQVLLGAAGVGVLGAIGVARHPGLLLAQAQGIYVYLAPLLVFLWCLAARPTPKIVRLAIGIVSAYLILSCVFMFAVQLPLYGVRGDWDRGLFSDAHIFGTWLAVASCAAFDRYLRGHGIGWLVGTFGFLVVSYFPANEKMIFFNVLVIGVLGARHLIRTRAVALLLIFVALALGGILFARSLLDQNIEARLTQLRELRVSQVGPVAAWMTAWMAFEDDPAALLIGVGPGNYGGIAAGRTLMTDERAATSATYRLRAELMTGQDLEGFLVSTNTWSNLAVEFGALGAALLAIAIITIVMPVWRMRPVTSFDATVRMLFLFSLGAVVFQGLFTPFTNWNEPIVVYPAMLFAAYLWIRKEIAANPGNNARMSSRQR